MESVNALGILLLPDLQPRDDLTFMRKAKKHRQWTSNMFNKT